jgi:allantoate deiminase
MAVQIERIQKDIGIINAFNATPEKGITRLTFSEEYQGAIAYVVDELKQVGAKISYCRAGNIKARLAGTDDNGPSVMMGSHLDTVVHGGRFDGVVGVVTALEAKKIYSPSAHRRRRLCRRRGVKIQLGASWQLDMDRKIEPRPVIQHQRHPRCYLPRGHG